MNNTQHEPLSPQGAARREAMLDELIEFSKQSHRMRRIRWGIVTAGATACLAVVLLRLAVPVGNGPSQTPEMVQDADSPRLPDGPPPRLVMLTVQTVNYLHGGHHRVAL